MAKQWFAWAARRGVQANTILNYDFCPWVNDYVYWLKRPIGWLAGAILAAVLLGAVVAPQAYAIAAALLGLVLVGTVWPYLAVRGVTGTIGWNRTRCNEGEEVTVELTLTNRWPIPLWGLIIDAESEAFTEGGSSNQTLALACVPPFSTSRFTWIARPSCRGCYPQRSAFIATGFPLGLWTAKRELKCAGELLVWPRTIPLKDLPQLGGVADSVVGATRDKAGYEGDVIGVRPYRDGDSLRSIHWAQTARRETLIVCERQSKAQQKVIVRLHLSETQPTDQQIRDDDEWLIRIGASICKEFVSHSWGVQLQVGEHFAVVEAGQRGIHLLMDTLARFRWQAASDEKGSKQRIKLSSQRRSDADMTIEISRLQAIEQKKISDRNNHETRWVGTFHSAQTTEVMTQWRVGGSLWMLVDLDRNIDSQVQRQWERVCHDTASAAG